ncbi:hypothetical protein SDC9_133874 [bioreactor metagenome]|uniref:Uncharacterized protein n=1 Tax=bioreactor metagenome TaxID=1076179 RepID=A0A645DDY5_9ZZZZ
MEFIQDPNSTKSFLNLEQRLSDSLTPVRPDPAFIDSLKHKLAQGTTTVIERHSSGHAELIIIGLGLATGALLVWLVSRLRK